MDNDGCGVILVLALFVLTLVGFGKMYDNGFKHGTENGVCIAKGGTYEWPHCVKRGGFINVKQP